MSSPANPVPVIVGGYAMYGEIGWGGMATVRFGRELGAAGLGRFVAIKCPHAQYAMDPKFRAMFLDEGRIASHVQHPNVVSTLDIVHHGGELLLVMEYVAGESLARLREAACDRGGPIPLRVILAIVTQLLAGLQAAHDARATDGTPLGIVHRDVSPPNVLVGMDGVTRVLDFGIARAAVRLETTGAGCVKGKLAYMAPEQLSRGDVTPAADVYATSIILWELLTGRRLFQAKDVHASIVDKLFQSVDAPSKHRRDLRAALDSVTLRGLERDPNQRFATAREMSVAIQAAAPGEIADPPEIAAWVRTLAQEALAARAEQVRRWESLPIVLHAAPHLGEHKTSSSPGTRGDSTGQTPTARYRWSTTVVTPNAFVTSVPRISLAPLLEPDPILEPNRRSPRTLAARGTWPVAVIVALVSLWLNANAGQRWLVGVIGHRPHTASAATPVRACR